MTKKRLQEINLKLELELPGDGEQQEMFDGGGLPVAGGLQALAAARQAGHHVSVASADSGEWRVTDCENEATCAGACADCK